MLEAKVELARLAHKYDVLPKLINKLRARLLKGAADAFGAEPTEVAPAIDVAASRTKIGELTMANDFCPVPSGRPACCRAQINDRSSTRAGGDAAGTGAGDQPRQHLIPAAVDRRAATDSLGRSQAFLATGVTELASTRRMISSTSLPGICRNMACRPDGGARRSQPR